MLNLNNLSTAALGLIEAERERRLTALKEGQLKAFYEAVDRLGDDKKARVERKGENVLVFKFFDPDSGEEESCKLTQLKAVEVFRMKDLADYLKGAGLFIEFASERVVMPEFNFSYEERVKGLAARLEKWGQGKYEYLPKARGVVKKANATFGFEMVLGQGDEAFYLTYTGKVKKSTEHQWTKEGFDGFLEDVEAHVVELLKADEEVERELMAEVPKTVDLYHGMRVGLPAFMAGEKVAKFFSATKMVEVYQKLRKAGALLPFEEEVRQAVAEGNDITSESHRSWGNSPDGMRQGYKTTTRYFVGEVELHKRSELYELAEKLIAERKEAELDKAVPNLRVQLTITEVNPAKKKSSRYSVVRQLSGQYHEVLAQVGPHYGPLGAHFTVVIRNLDNPEKSVNFTGKTAVEFMKKIRGFDPRKLI